MKRDPYPPTWPALDTAKWPKRKGLEGPFRFASGRILYYDSREGQYYDSTTDYYVSDSEMIAHMSKQ